MKMIKLYHGDYKELLKEIPDYSVDLAILDPPYGIDFRDNLIGFKSIRNDRNMNIVRECLKLIYKKLKSNAHIYLFTSFKVLDYTMQICRELYDIRNVLVWKKVEHNNRGDINSYANIWEAIIFLSKKGQRKPVNKRWVDVLEFKSVPSEKRVHPHEKPFELIKFLVEESTREGDTVLDPFAGSGVVGKVCKMLNRNYYGAEIDNHYYKVAYKNIFDSVYLTEKKEKPKPMYISQINWREYDIEAGCFDILVKVRVIKNFPEVVLSNMKTVKGIVNQVIEVPLRDAVVFAKKGWVEDIKILSNLIEGGRKNG